jgi:hypothetical protein
MDYQKFEEISKQMYEGEDHIIIKCFENLIESDDVYTIYLSANLLDTVGRTRDFEIKKETTKIVDEEYIKLFW